MPPASIPPPPRPRNLFFALSLAERLIERCLALSVQALQTDVFVVFVGCESNGVATATSYSTCLPLSLAAV